MNGQGRRGGNHLVWNGGVMTRRLQSEDQSERQAEQKSVIEYISAGGGRSRKIMVTGSRRKQKQTSGPFPLHFQ